MLKTRRFVGDPFIWEIIHFLTMTLLGHRITRGYAVTADGEITDRLVCIYWDKASNWTGEGDDWHRKEVPYPTPFWRSKR